MLERILVGADGSEVADHALDQALRLAAITGAEVQAAHVLETHALYGSAPSVDPRILEAREQVGHRVLEDAADTAARHDVRLDTTLLEGPAAQGLVDEADEWGADLVALGTHGHGAMTRAIVGSVADRLVRSSPVPVLTVSQEPAAGHSDPIERILVPSDGSPAALAVAPFAVELAKATGAQAELLFAITPELEGGAHLDRPASGLEEAHEEMVDEALAPLEAQCEDAGVACSRTVVHEPAHRAIVDAAEEGGADLIVMATHGRGGIERFLLGSVTDKVVRTARTPVVTVRPDEDG